jgi:hypothetical protein
MRLLILIQAVAYPGVILSEAKDLLLNPAVRRSGFFASRKNDRERGDL